MTLALLVVKLALSFVALSVVALSIFFVALELMAWGGEEERTAIAWLK